MVTVGCSRLAIAGAHARLGWRTLPGDRASGVWTVSRTAPPGGGCGPCGLWTGPGAYSSALWSPIARDGCDRISQLQVTPIFACRSSKAQNQTTVLVHC